MSIKLENKHNHNYYVKCILLIVVVFAGIIGGFIDITTNASPLVEKAYAFCGPYSSSCSSSDTCSYGGWAKGLC